MTEIFLLIGMLLLSICAVLYFMPNLKILNFVHYGNDQMTAKINRYASVRLLLPATVFLAGSFLTQVRPQLMMPLLFPCIISILVSVVWITAGVTHIADESGKN